MARSFAGFLDRHWSPIVDVVVVAVVVLTVGLRIVPAVLLGVPFLPDPWVHIGKADAILQTGFFNIWGDYDDHWPGLNGFMAVFSMLTGVDTIVLGWLVVPLLCGLSLVFFYLMMRRVTGNQVIALVCVVVLGFAAPLTLIMGTTYKEALARMLLAGALCAFVVRGSKQLGHVVPVVVLAVAIIPVHHISVLVTGSVIIFVVLSLLVFQWRTGVLEFWQWLAQTLAYLMFFVVGLVYFVVFEIFQLLLVDARLLGIGLVVSVVVLGVLNLKRILSPTIGYRTKVFLLVVSLGVLVVFVLNSLAIPVFEYTVLPPSSVLLLSPLLALMGLAALGFISLDRVERSTRIFLSSFLFALLTLLVVALISGGAALNLILTYRMALFTLAPLAALAGVGVFAYFVAHPWRARYIQVLLLVALLAVLPATTLAWTHNPIFGYGATVTPPIQASNQWIANHTNQADVLVAGDHLFTYYFLYYLKRPASVEMGFDLFVRGDTSQHYDLVGVHRFMFDNGFWLPSGVQLVPIDLDVIQWLNAQPYNALVYNNGDVQLYRRL